MDLDKIGAILRNRIKECGYTQEDFAEVAGVGLSSLKKYMSGAICYDIISLEKFSKVLRCSYEYLLGESETPILEYKTIKESTNLSDGAIERLIDAKDEGMTQVHIFDYLIQNDKLIQNVEDYIFLWLNEVEAEVELKTEKEKKDKDERYMMLDSSYNIKNQMRIGNYTIQVPELYNVYLTGIITAFTENLANYGENLSRKQYYFPGQKIKRKQYLTEE